ncbi:WAS/WASL-interacting protein family member 1-like [Uranotaenia lowii]|uniref:WAS/WASL-interacting protein family member 1-like n=1 Tax=Uranotaenia lowii TaxID=190385 RepID=UPI00247AD7FC|nr:WAS/WASL-interacting protein family member 1-like [Uranotaenia lowii]
MCTRVISVVLLLFVVLLSTASSSTPTRSNSRQIELQTKPPRRGRFLGLLGLLTGLTLVDSLEDSDSVPVHRAPAGSVKINFGRPYMESSYIHYAYNPFYYGAVPSINIKIPFHSEGDHGDFGGGGGGFGSGGFGAGAFVGGGGGGGGGIGGHHGVGVIEPRPILGDEPQEVPEESLKEVQKKFKSTIKLKRSRLPTTRLIRSTSSNKIKVEVSTTAPETPTNQLDEPVTAASDPAAPELPPPAPISTVEPLVATQVITAIPVTEDHSLDLKPDAPQPVNDTPAAFVLPQSYFGHHSGTLQDPSTISLTSTERPQSSAPLADSQRAPFRPSRPDRLQDYYSSFPSVSVAGGGVSGYSPQEFRPIV